jgi:hypothetical protein
MAANSPLARVKDQFGDKEKLVASLEKLTSDDLWVSRTNQSKGLAHVSNAKLLRLHAVFTEVKAKFGTREKLIDAILELEKRSKDAGLRQKLLAWPVPRLFDAYRSAARRAGVAAKPATPKAKAPGAKPQAKAPVGQEKPAKKAAAPGSRDKKSGKAAAPKAAKKGARR